MESSLEKQILPHSGRVLPMLDLTTTQEEQSRMRSQDSDSDSDHLNLSARVSRSFYQKESSHCIIQCSNPWRIRWDLLIIILALYSSISVPLSVAFQAQQEYILFEVWEYIVDSLFAIDIIVNFRATYIDRQGDQIFDSKAIAKRYILSGNFFIDVLATIPFQLLPQFFSQDVDSKQLQLFQVLKLVRLLRLRRIITYLKFKTDFKLSLRILLIIFNLFLFVHLAACFWHLLVIQNKEWMPPKDAGRQSEFYDEDKRSSKYTTSLYYASLMLLGADILPYDKNQTAYACVILLAGSIVTASLFGHMTVLVQSLNKKTAKFHQQLDIANQAMTNISLPDSIQTTVLEYITYTYSNRDHQDQFKKFTSMISPSLKHDVYTHLYRDILMRNEILADEEELVENMIDKLNTNLEQPQQTIVERGELGDSIFFISRGELQVNLLDKRGVEQMTKQLAPGDYFGEIALITTARRTATVLTKNYCTIAQMSKVDLLDLLDRFPNFKKAMHNNLHTYQDEWQAFLVKSIQRIPFFSRCTHKELSLIAFTLKQNKIQRNTVLAKRGQKVDYLLIVGTGELQVVIQREKSHDLLVAYLERGASCFVTSGLVDFTQQHTVRVSQTGVMLTINKEAFKDLLQLIPKLTGDWTAFVKSLENDKTKGDYIYGSISAYRKSPSELALIKFRLATLKVLRQIAIEREKNLSEKMSNFLNIIDQLLEKQRSEKDPNFQDPNYQFKKTLRNILHNTNLICEKIKEKKK